MTTRSHVTPESQEPPAAELEPRGVLVGADGDPLSIGLIFFGIGALALGMSLIGPTTTFLPAQSQDAMWATLLGQSLVAAIFSTFAALWLSSFSAEPVVNITHRPSIIRYDSVI